MNGALMGLTREEIDQHFPDIEAFAEIGAFIDQPVKTYSSGMLVRLGFSSAVCVDPEILVVDEALSVGDIFFQHKCLSKMKSFQTAGKTILLVSHDINLIKSFCNIAFLMNDGKILDSGDPEYVTEQYLMLIRQKQTENASRRFQVVKKTQMSLPEAKINFGSEAGQILEVGTLDEDLKETSAFLAGTTIVIRVKVQIDPIAKNPSILFILRDERGYNIYGTDTVELGIKPQMDEYNQTTVFFSLSSVLRPGSYSLVVELNDFYTPKVNIILDRQVGVGTFYVIENKSKFLGVVDLQAKGFQNPNRIINNS
jgi:lipopolysaccharide transport system ATP-binding protein